jgi:hypothetical protein
MDKMAKMEALKEMMGDKTKKNPFNYGGEIPPHEVTCPNCGYEWTMGEEEYEDEDEDMDEEDMD